jgi:hypothetical protein
MRDLKTGHCHCVDELTMSRPYTKQSMKMEKTSKAIAEVNSFRLMSAGGLS